VIFLQKHEKKDALISLSCTREYNIKRDLTRYMLLGCKWINLFQTIGSPDEHGDQPQGSKQTIYFLCRRSDCERLKKNSVVRK